MVHQKRSKPERLVKNTAFPYLIAIGIYLLFFIAYSVLAVVRHDHYESFGYDLGINTQTVWRYSTLQPPLTTSDPFPDRTKLATHVELVYALISPFFWIWSSARMLLIVEAAFLCSGSIAVFLLSRERGLRLSVSLAILFSYLTFFGLQNAAWFDTHSASFAAAFLAWFLYFLNKNHLIGTAIFFILAITAKENIAFITFFIALIYFISRRNTRSLILMALSLLYLFFIFFVYFPYIIHTPYLYQNHAGLLSNLNPLDMVNTAEKVQTIFYSLFSYGFLPIMNPLLLVPVFADLATYFVIGSDLPGAQSIFMHYRVTLTPLLAWATIGTITKYKFLNSRAIALYLVIVACIIQYSLHLPLSYLSKPWFWTEPSGVKNINAIKNTLQPTDAVVAQNNIIPHISRRDKIYTLYPEKKMFTPTASPCGKPECAWFRWYGKPTYLFVDTSPEWDIRHFLTNREEFLNGLENLEKQGVIVRSTSRGTATLYKVKASP